MHLIGKAAKRGSAIRQGSGCRALVSDTGCTVLPCQQGAPRFEAGAKQGIVGIPRARYSYKQQTLRPVHRPKCSKYAIDSAPRYRRRAYSSPHPLHQMQKSAWRRITGMCPCSSDASPEVKPLRPFLHGYKTVCVCLQRSITCIRVECSTNYGNKVLDARE